MRLSIRDWRPSHLLGAWGAYWATLATVTFGPALLVVSQLRAVGTKGSATIGFSNDILSAQIQAGASSAWEWSASLATIGLWVAGPPLVLWAIWLATRRSPGAGVEREGQLPSAQPVLGAGAAAPLGSVRRDARPQREREEVE